MVSVIMGVIVGLTFLFGFGNVLNLALRLGVSPWVAPLVAPAVDLSVLALLLGTRHLAIGGADATVMRPARRLLLFSSVVTLALNVADPLLAGEWGRAAFDAVGPLLLIGWAEVGPGLLRALVVAEARAGESPSPERADPEVVGLLHRPADVPDGPHIWSAGSSGPAPDDLLDRTRRADAEHWLTHRRPISAETLRRRLEIGAKTARVLVAQVRQEYAVTAAGAPHVSGAGTRR